MVKQMKRIVNLSLGAVFSVLGALSASAEPDGSTWTAEALTADTSGIRTDGYLVYAYARGDYVVNAGTKNAVPFAAMPSMSFADLDWNLDDFGLPAQSDPGDLADDGYENLLRYCWSNNSKALSLVLKNLVPGREYLVQILGCRTDTDNNHAVWIEESGDRNIFMRAGSDGWPYGGTLVGRFVASATTQKFNIQYVNSGEDWASFNGVQVRDLSGMIPPGATAAETHARIQSAIDAAAVASPAGIVTLDEGLFEIDAQLMVTGGVTLVGCGWEKTILKYAGSVGANARVATISGSSTVKRVTVTGGCVESPSNGDTGGGLKVLSAAGDVITITECCVSNNVSGRSSGGGVFVAGSGTVKIDHSIISDNKAETYAGNDLQAWGGGISSTSDNTVTIEIDTCLVCNNTVGHEGGESQLGGGIGIRRAASVTIRNTTIANNGAPTAGAGLYSEKPVTLQNCIISDNVSKSGDGNVAFGTGGSLTSGSSNNFTGNGTAALGTDSVSSAGSGGFVNVAKGDYHLASGSPALGCGTGYSGIADDLDGVARSQTGATDPGCYESDSAPLSGSWSETSCAPGEWTPLARNVLAGVAGVKESGAISGYGSSDLSVLTDGAVPTAAGKDWIVGPQENAKLSWSFSGRTTIEQIRLSACYLAQSPQYDGISITAVEVKFGGSDVWTELAVPAESWGGTATAGQINLATLTNEVGPLAQGVTALRLTFGAPEVTLANYYAEVEAVGLMDGDWYVATTGSDTDNDGRTREAPFATVEKAMSVARAGEIVSIAAGEYDMTQTIVLDKGVKIYGAGKGETVLDFQGACRGVEMSDAEALVEGLVISNGLLGADNGEVGAGVKMSAGTVRNCLVTDCKAGANYKNGGAGGGIHITGGTVTGCEITRCQCAHLYGTGNAIYMKGDDAVVTGCDIHHNDGGYSHSDPGNGAASVHVEFGTLANSRIHDNTKDSVAGVMQFGGTIINCLVYNNTSTQVAAGFYKKDGGGSARNGNTYNCTFYNNICTKNGADACGIYVSGGGETKNCIFLRNAPTGSAVAPVTVASGVFENNVVDVDVAGYFDNIVGDPLFTDAANGDFTLASGNSAAYRSGVPLAAVMIDIDGVARDAAEPCCGAYESPVDERVPVVASVSVSPEETTASLYGTIDSLGTGATACDVYLAVSPYGQAMGEPVRILEGATDTISYSITGLQPGTLYSYRLFASNEVGFVSTRNTDHFVTAGDVRPSGSTDGRVDGVTIQTLIDIAANEPTPGTVELGEGTFYIDKQLMVTGGVTLVGQGWEKTTLEQVGAPGTDTRVATLMDDSVLRGVMVTGGNLSGSWAKGAGVLIKAGTVSWCCVSNNVISGWNVVGGGISFFYKDYVGHGQVDHSIITGNEIVHGSQKGGYGAGIGMRNGDGDVVIDTCLIYGNRVSTGDNNFGGGVGQDGGTSVAGGGYLLTIRNTTISDNYSKGKAGGLYVGSNWRAELENVILAGNLAGESESNIAFNGTSSSQTSGNNNLFGLEDEMLGENATFGDPAFVGPDNGDYSLLATSPACDAGKWYEGIVVDLDGNAREDPSDIGCYELLGEIAFGRAKATAVRSTAVSLSTELLRIGETATGADVYLAYGTDADDLGESILVKEGAVAEEPLTQLLTGLDRETTYYYCFYATNNATPAANSIRKGSFTTPTAELLTLGKPFVDASATRANVNLRVLKLGEDATAAEVWFQWGTEPDALGESVLVNPDADVNEVSTGEMTGLEKGMTYYFRFSVTNNAPADAQAKAVDGEFTTPQPEHLVLGTPVASPRATSATVSLQVVTLGEGATYASVYFYCYDKDGTEINRTTLAAVKGETCVATLPELGPNEVYTYRFVVTNNGTPVETKEASGSFMTLNSDYDHAYGDYPATVPAGSVVTFVASDDITPFRVVPAEDYTKKVHSTSMNKDFYFRSEADFESNASAMIGEDYYLFLGDAVRAAVTSNTIEVIRDNNMVAETMQIKIPLTINGNGHTVKVNTPFVAESGYVNTNCTVSPKVVFQIQNGGDVLLRDMKVMGGGQQLMGNAEGLNDASTPAIVVGNTQSLTQNGATGILQLENVTVTRSQGALFVAQGALAYVDRCQLVRNCRYCAGGIYNRGTCVVVNSSMSENRSLYSVGGGGAIENQGTMYMNNCVICNNSSTEDGGAINEFSNIGGSKLYMMNSTLSGNFSTRYEYDGGGMALRVNGAKFYAVNNLICNNYYYNNSGNGSVTPSDLRFPDNPTTENGMYYNVYGDISGKVAASMNGQAITAGGDFGSALAAGGNAMVVDDNQDVFLDYYAATRVYQNLNDTKIKIDGSRLYQSSTEPLARYAPIDPYGKGVLGDAGALTYFDASDWRDGVVRMSYRTLNGEMTALGGIPMATDDDLVTTFYESEIVPDTIERSIGIAGASGWVLSDVKYWTLKLIEDPKYGSVDNITIFGDTYHDGATVVITATPEKYCTFLGWYDEADNLVSPSAVTAVLMTRDIDLKAKFSPPAAVMDLDVLCEQTAPTHENFRISITTNWLAEAFSDICPDGVVTSVNSNEVAAALNNPDPDNGLNHVWQNYVLGLKKGEKNGRIWINSVQTENAGTIRLFTQPLIPVQASGFSVKYRLDRKQGGDWTRTTTVNENSRETAGEFDVATSVNTNGNYVVDLIFIPDGYMTSEEYVTSVNTAGVLKVESAKAVEILAAPWSAFAPSNTPASVSAAEYVKAKCLTPGDRLYVYDQAVGKYEAWKVALDGASWQPIAVFTLVNGVVTATEQIPASQAFIPRGSGVWLERQDVTKPIYLYGQLDSRMVTTSLEPGFNLVGNPYPTTFDASTLPGPTVMVGDGDHIVIPTGGEPINCTFDPEKGKWGSLKDVPVPVYKKDGVTPKLDPRTGEPMYSISRQWTTEGMVLPVGFGFWYDNRNAGSIELVWPVPHE